MMTKLAIASLTFAPLTAAFGAELGIIVHTAGPMAGSVTSTIIHGEKEAVLVDVQLTRAEALRLSAAILETGKKLTHVLVTHAHPDHYLGLETIASVFPEANIVALPHVVADIRERAPKRLPQLKEMLGANGPRKFVVPKEFKGTTLALDGSKLEIHTAQGDDGHPVAMVWVPSRKTLVAGDVAFSGGHVWTAETTPAQRKEWMKGLDGIMAKYQPERIIPGHKGRNGTEDAAQVVAFTKSYLEAFDEEVAKGAPADEIVKAMKARFPDLDLEMAIQLGAKKNARK